MVKLMTDWVCQVPEGWRCEFKPNTLLLSDWIVLGLMVILIVALLLMLLRLK